MKVCSFTGHRRIDKAHTEKIGSLVARAIEYSYSEGCRRFIAGGALGFDTVAAREVIRFRMKHPDACFVLYLPCLDQDKKWTERQRSLYEYLLSEADEVVYVSDEYTEGCMRERNRRLAEEADILIAYVSRYNSGAWQTVSMAKKLGKAVYNLYPTLKEGEKGV